MKSTHEIKATNVKKSKRIFIRTIIVIAIVLLIIGLVGILIFNSKLNKLQREENKPKAKIEYDIPNLDKDKKLMAEGSVFKDKNVFNVLLIGTDERAKKFSDNARADSIMLLSINKKTKKANLVSFERGIGVSVQERDDDWLTHVFRYGGANLLIQTIRDYFKVDVNKYVRVNFDTFIKGINCINGIDVELSSAEVGYLKNDSNHAQNLVVGKNHVNGSVALSYARTRKIDSDWSRIKRQRKVIQSAIMQTKNLSVLEFNDIANEVLPLIKTNLTNSEIISLLLVFPDFTGVTLGQMTIPIKGTYWSYKNSNGRSMFGVDFKKNAKELHKFLY